MFKHNQVEQAIINVRRPEPAPPEALLRNQIKRLLDTDRSLGRNKRSTPSAQISAFLQHSHAGQGS
jgi:hypothetical protein